MKSAGSKTGAVDSAVIVLLQTGAIEGNFETWREATRKAAADLPLALSLHLSFLDTDKEYVPAQVNKNAIYEKNAIPDEDLTEETKEMLIKTAVKHRQKVMQDVEDQGTNAFQFLITRCSHASVNNIEAHADFATANNVAPKNAFALWEIIKKTHASGGAAGLKVTRAEKNLIDDEFNLFNQGRLSLGDFWKQYKFLLAKRKAVGLGDVDEVSKFYAKLNQSVYEEMIRGRANAERELLVAGMPIPEETLAGAYEFTRGYKLAPGTEKKSSSLGVFTTIESTPNEAIVTDAIDVLAAQMDIEPSVIMLALKNSTIKSKSKAAAVGAGSAGTGKVGGGAIMVRGRPWSKPCLQPGCGLHHPYWLHEALTGGKLNAELQAKMAAFETRKREKANGKAGDLVAVTIADYPIYESGTADNVEDDEDDDTRALFFVGVASVRNSPFSANYVLFDTQAALSLFMDATHLTNVRDLEVPRHILGVTGPDGGALIATQEGLFRDFGYVVIAPGAYANIISQRDCHAWGVEIIWDEETQTYTLRGRSHDLVFNLLPDWDAHFACSIRTGVSESTDDIVCISRSTIPTVANNLALYTPQQRKQAARARELQIIAGLQSTARTTELLKGIDNAGVTGKDLVRADALAGKPLAKVRGGTKQQGQIVARVEVEEPRSVDSQAESGWFEIDLLYIQGLAFLIALLLPRGYVMCRYLQDKTTAEIGESIDMCTAEAKSLNVDVQIIRCDGERGVAAYAKELNRNGTVVDLTAAGEHLPHVERVNQDVKNYVRGQMNGGLPYRMGKLLIVMCVMFIVSRLNIFVSKGSPDGLSAFEGLKHRRIDRLLDLRAPFGAYVEATKPNTDNSMASRTEACIVGWPTYNLTGSMKMLKLSTMKIVTRRTFAIRPIPDNIIQELNELADEDGKIGGDQPYCDDYSFDDIEDDVEQPGVLNAAAPQPPEIGVEAGVIAETENILEHGVVAAESGVEIADDYNVEPVMNRGANENQQRILPLPAKRGRHGNGARFDPLQSLGVKSVQSSTVLTAMQHQSLKLPTIASQSGLSGRASAVVIANLSGIKEFDDREAARRHYFLRKDFRDKDFCFKITVKAAIRERGAEAKTAIVQELSKIMEKKVWHGVHLSSLTKDQCARILRSHMFLKDKYTSLNIFDKFKARLVARGDMQDRTDYTDYDIAGPTSTTASILSIAAIAAAEERKVMTIDVGGAFLNADIKRTGVLVHVRLDKIMTGFLVEIAPEFSEFVNEDGSCVVELDKALYGTLEAAKLWYDNISTKLMAEGFEPNPYDSCVFNKVNRDGLQVTVALYVDDLMVTCEDERELDAFAAFLRASYAGDITEHRGDIAEYLAMTFDFRTRGEVRVTMKKLIDDIIAGCGVTAERSTPATDELFNVREDAVQLDQQQKDYFRTYVAKLLYVAKRVRPEILAAVSFLTTRALVCDADDLAKLHRVLGYVKKTRDRGIVLRIGEFISVEAYIDAAYGVHTSSGKSHTGCAIVLGNGPVFVKSTKQKIVSKSSTEAELIALSDSASQAIWVANFINAQGYDVGPVVLHQDNMSCMALVKRGSPASERSRHIDIRYFWVKQLVDGKAAVVRHLATELMHANVMTKAVQGKQFIDERDRLTNWPSSQVTTF